MAGLAQNFDLTNEFNILRILCGLFLLPHFFAKATNLEFMYGVYTDFRLYPPKAWVWACMVVEVICAVGLIFGIYTRYVAIMLAIFMAVAAWAVWRFSGGKWLWNIGGYEYPVFWGVCCVVIAMHG